MARQTARSRATAAGAVSEPAPPPTETAALALVLDEMLDLAAAAPLHRDLLGRRGAAVTIDASSVRRLGGLCLQVLLSAAATWRQDGHALTLRAPSEAFRECVSMLGADLLAEHFVETAT